MLGNPLSTRSLAPATDQLDADRLAAAVDEAVATFAASFVIGADSSSRR